MDIHKLRFYRLVLILFLQCTFSLPVSAEVQLLINSGFEDGTFTGWKTYGTANFIVNLNLFRSGLYSGQINPTNTSGAKYLYQEEITVNSGKTYQLSGYVYKNDPAYSNVKLRIRWQSGTGSADLETGTTTNSINWQYLNVTTTVPIDVSTATIQLYTFINSTITWTNPVLFDDISFIRLTPPATVTDLQSSIGKGQSDIVLTWTSPGDDGTTGTLVQNAEFRVQYTTSDLGPWTSDLGQIRISTSGINPGTLCTYNLTNLSSGTSFYFRIWTADEIPNWSDGSNIATIYLPPIVSTITVPSAPDTFIGTVLSTTSIRWEWRDNANNEIGYRIKIGSMSEVQSPMSVVADLSANTTTYQHLNLASNTSYTMYVEAYNEVASSKSQVASAWTLANPPVGTQVVTVTTSQIIIQWTQNSNPTGTVYQVNISTGTDFNPANIVSTTFLTFQHINLSPNTTYYYKMRAVNGDGIVSSFDTIVSTVTLSSDQPVVLSYQHINVFNDVVINEIMYNPTGSDVNYEWLEIFNRTTDYIDLTGWVLTEDGTNHKLSFVQGGSSIPAKGYAIIADNSGSVLDPYRTDPVSSTWMVIDTVMNLSNTGESIVLRDVNNVLISSVTYTSSWNNNIEGKSVEKKNPGLPETDRWSWTGSISTGGGTPGKQNSVTAVIDDIPPGNVTDLVAVPGTNDGEIVLTWTAPGDNGYSGNIIYGMYEIRYSTADILDFNNPPYPYYKINVSTTINVGSKQSYLVNRLYSGTTYFFSLNTGDTVGNISQWQKSSTYNITNFATAQDLPPSTSVNIRVSYY